MKRIKYISQFSRDLSFEEIDIIVSTAEEKNRQLGVTGILMSSGRVFYQVMEGPDAHVDELYGSIQTDNRHSDVLLLEMENNADEHYFPDWSMKRFVLDEHADERLEPVHEMLVNVMAKRKEIAELTNVMEHVIWYELASMVEDNVDA